MVPVILIEQPSLLHIRSVDCHGSRAAEDVRACNGHEIQISSQCGETRCARLRRGARLPRSQSDGRLPPNPYIVVGGLGGLGLHCAPWLLSRGAEAVVLTSRSGRVSRHGQGLQERLDALHSDSVDIVCADASEPLDVVATLGRQTMAAGQLYLPHVEGGDLIRAISARRFAAIFFGKALGAWQVHASLEVRQPLYASFVASSVATFGGARAAPYSAANAFLDALSRAAVSRGLKIRCANLPVLLEAGTGASAFVRQLLDASSVLRAIALSIPKTLGVIDYMVWGSHAAGSVHAPLPVDQQQTVRGLEGIWMPKHCLQHSGMLSELKISVDVHHLNSSTLPALQRPELAQRVLALLHEITGLPQTVDLDTPFMEAGVDSMMAVEFVAQLCALASVELPPTLIFEHSTPRAVVRHIEGSCAPTSEPVDGQQTVLSCVRLAMSGLSYAWPGHCATPHALGTLLSSSGDAVTTVPSSRWSHDEALRVSGSSEIPTSVGYGSFVAGAAQFDHVIFGVSSAEAAAMDPQHRLLLEKSYRSFHNVGRRRVQLAGSDLGVFLGVERPDWPFLIAQQPTARLSVYAATGDTVSVAGGRISFVLGLHGPCVSLDTACSSSVAAAHTAAHVVQAVECSAAMVVSVSLKLLVRTSLIYANAGMLSLDGRCKTLDANANGYIRAEGVGALVLHHSVNEDVEVRLQGSAIRQDGRSASLTAPNASAQRMLIRAAMSAAGTSTGVLRAVEMHGTGTALGDPTEASAILTDLDTSAGALALGAAKANYGHAEPTAGMLGLVAAANGLGSRTLAGFAHLKRLNPLVLSNLHLQPSLVPTQKLTGGDVTVKGVSAFGYSGTIAHVVLKGSGVAARPHERHRYRHIFFWWRKVHDQSASTKESASQTSYSVEWASLKSNCSFVKNERMVHSVLLSSWRCSTALQGEVAVRGWNARVVKVMVMHDGQTCSTVAAVADLVSEVVLQGHPSPLWLITSGSQEVLPAKTCASSLSGFSGLARALRCELYPRQVVCVDVHVKEASSLLADWVAAGTVPLVGGSVRGLQIGDHEEVEVVMSAHVQRVPRLVTSDASRRVHSIAFEALSQRVKAAVDRDLQRFGDVESINAGYERMDALCAQYIRMAVQSVKEEEIELEHLKKLFAWCKVQPTQNVGHQVWMASHVWDPTDVVTPEDVLNQHAGLWPEVELLRIVGPMLADAITSRVRYIDLLFPEGSFDLVQPYYNKAIIAQICNAGVMAATAEAVAQLPSTQSIRIVEIGAGTGGTAADVLPVISERCEQYLFTDVSDVFLVRAKEKLLGTYPFLRFALLNVDVDPRLQGIASYTFDMLIATNCLHATPNIRHTAHVCRQLLCAGGVVVINDLPKTNPYLQITFGLTDGWWFFQDSVRSGNDSPAISCGEWFALLRDVGFSDMYAAQAADACAAMDRQAVILAQVAILPPPAELGRDPETAISVVTGGLGGLGLVTAQRLATERRSTVRLVSRSGNVQQGGEHVWRELQDVHARYTSVIRCDVSKHSEVQQLCRTTSCDGRLHRIIHTANDFVAIALPRQTAHVCVRNFSAKVYGAESLHTCSLALPLRSFVNFSSYSTLIGGIGVVSYISACAWLETQGYYRCKGGLVGQTILWGEVGEVGAAARLNGAMSVTGVHVMHLGTTQHALSKLVSGSCGLNITMLIDWTQLDPLLVQTSFVIGAKYASRHNYVGSSASCSSDENVASGEQAPGATAQDILNDPTRLETALLSIAMELTGNGTVGPSTPLMDAGIDSLAATEFANQVGNLSGIKMPPILLFNYPTVTQIVAFLTEGRSAPALSAPAVESQNQTSASFLSIHGIAGRWPGETSDKVHLHRLLASSGDAVGTVPVKRWVMEARPDDDPGSKDSAIAASYMGVVSNVDAFDNSFFHISPAEAEAMDPQQRVLLETTYVSLHAKGLRRKVLHSRLTGAFLAMERPDWTSVRATLPKGATSAAYAATSDTVSIAAGRISFSLGLEGPCVTMDAACASALTAVSTAARYVGFGDCIEAIVCAAAFKLHMQWTLSLAGAGMLSLKGHSFTLDRRADGYARADGVGSHVLTAGDDGQLQFSCSKIMQDGRSASLTAPNGRAQRSLLLSIWRAQLSSPLGRTEMHGTGTPLGDPIEVGSLADAYYENCEAPLVVGAVKANMGHTECTSGLTGIHKTLCCMSAHISGASNALLRILNPLVQPSLLRNGKAFALPVHTLCESRSNSYECSYFHGISSFGYSGTIAHVALSNCGWVEALPSYNPARLSFHHVIFGWAKTSTSGHVAFLGSRVADTLDVRWSQKLSALEVTFLCDHVIGEVPVVPGTCYIETVRALMSTMNSGGEAFGMLDIAFKNIMFLDNVALYGAPHVLVIYEQASGLLRIDSQQDKLAWITHLETHLHRIKSSARLTDLQLRAAESLEIIPAEPFYAALGNKYKGEFRSMETATLWTDDSTIAKVTYDAVVETSVRTQD